MTEQDILFRQATEKDGAKIWEILQEAIDRRKKDGSMQWQSGYPNEGTVTDDIREGYGFVVEMDGEIAAYTALIFNDEPAYENIDGKWLSDEEFYVIHRVAVSEKFAGKGLVKILFGEIEKFVKAKNIRSIKVDTNFDNPAMIHILENKGYTYCGEVMLKGALRKAFEKLIY